MLIAGQMQIRMVALAFGNVLNCIYKIHTGNKILEREGALLLSKNDRPLAVVIDVHIEETAEQVLRLVSQIRAQFAVSRMRGAARERGLDRLSPEEIRAEIRAVRSTRLE